MMIGYTLWGLLIAYCFYHACGLATGKRKPDIKVRPRGEQAAIGFISVAIQLTLLLLVFNGI